GLDLALRGPERRDGGAAGHRTHVGGVPQPGRRRELDRRALAGAARRRRRAGHPARGRPGGLRPDGPELAGL
ncbi:MAG: FIG01124521: hypothetical protein, partial [uncultured Frankineae bacterium]